mgnify:CR=1 FL=1
MKSSPFQKILHSVSSVSHSMGQEHKIDKLLATPRMQRFNGQLPLNKKGLVRDDDLLSINGWLSPEGVLYACRWGCHKHVMHSFHFAHEAEMEKKGFVKLTGMVWLVESKYCETTLTDEQQYTIKKWFTLNQLDLKFYKKLNLNGECCNDS